MRDDGNHQTLRGLCRDAEMHRVVTVDDAVLVVVAGVHLREVGESRPRPPRIRNGSTVNRDSLVGVLSVELGAQPFDLGDVDLFDIREVWDAGLGDVHPLGDVAAQTR